MDIRKLALRAALQRLCDGADSPDLVNESEQYLRQLLAEIDDIRYTERMREDSDWTKSALENAGLERIGNFQIRLSTSKKYRVISFEDEGVRIEFHFVRDAALDVQKMNMDTYLKRAIGAREEEIKANVQALLASTLSRGSGKDTSPDENLLGGIVFALDYYTLVRVERVTQKGFGRLFGIKCRQKIWALS